MPSPVAAMDDSCEHIVLNSRSTSTEVEGTGASSVMVWRVQSRSVLIIVVNQGGEVKDLNNAATSSTATVDCAKYKDLFGDHLLLITQGKQLPQASYVKYYSFFFIVNILL